MVRNKQWNGLGYGFIIMLSMIVAIVCMQSDGTSSLFEVEASNEDSIDTSIPFFQPEEDDGLLTIRYFDLKHREKSGDSILIKSPEGKTMLIDAGTTKVGPQLFTYLDKIRIDNIDIAVATHPHHDHIGGFFSLIGKRPIDHLYMPEIPIVSKLNKQFHMLLARRHVHVDYLTKGDTFKLGQHVQVEVLNPGPIPKRKKWTTRQVNQQSLVLKVTYKEKTFLFASDIYKPTELKLVEEYDQYLQADFLDIAHHGHRTSSAPPFIDKVSPEIAVMSSNTSKWKKNYKKITESGVKTYVTEKDGHLLIRSNGESIEVIKEK